MIADSTSTTTADEARSASLRWVVLALVFAAGIINYADRQIIALLKPMLEQTFGWSDRDYGHLVSAFQFAAATAYLFAGWFIDRTGLRFGYSLAVGLWSAAAIAHAAARSVLQFTLARVVLGVAEAVNTPASVKAVTIWFPAAERSIALGIMNTATNIGAVITPLIVPVLALQLGWQAAFVVVGATGFVWLLGWSQVRHPQQLHAAASTPGPVPWSSILRNRATWAIAGAKALTDQVWWFVLFWMPDFFNKTFAVDMRNIGPPIATIYVMAAAGALFGGWIPAKLVAAGMSVDSARKGTLGIAALIVLPLPLVFQVESYWSAVLLVGLALAAHQAFSTNIFALTADVIAPRVVASTISVGALCGNLSGLAMLEFTGWMLDTHGIYWPMFAIASVSYVLAFLWIRLLVPRIEPA
jgi:ACS family hexuronate transporter-like MFS transporter